MSFLSDLLGDSYKPGMSEEDISSALEAAKVGKGIDELDKLKTSLSKANAQAADFKKQLRAKQTDDEAAALAQKEEHDKLVQANQELTAQVAKMERVTELCALGYDKALAESTADAMAKGDMTAVMDNQKKFFEAQEKARKAADMRGTPRPAVGSGDISVDYAKKIAEAEANGDFTSAAYYTRLSQQAAPPAQG